jgi:hypothetical protein
MASVRSSTAPKSTEKKVMERALPGARLRLARKPNAV